MQESCQLLKTPKNLQHLFNNLMYGLTLQPLILFCGLRCGLRL